MTQFDTNLIIRIAIAIVFAVIAGNGSVVAFNNMPAKWFEDYDEDDPGKEVTGEPRKMLPPALVEADNAGRQRLPSTPWKYIFVSYFAICGIYLAIRGGGAAYEIGVLCTLFLVLEMAIADELYQVVPDQLSLALMVVAIAFINYFDNWWEQPAGALVGFTISMTILILGHLIFKTGSIGGADIKFFTCMGLVVGRLGIIIIFILTTIFFAAYSVYKIAIGRGTIKDQNAMLPPACAAVTVYFLFLWSMAEIFVVNL